jgi:hypothetical protein
MKTVIILTDNIMTVIILTTIILYVFILRVPMLTVMAPFETLHPALEAKIKFAAKT